MSDSKCSGEFLEILPGCFEFDNKIFLENIVNSIRMSLFQVVIFQNRIPILFFPKKPISTACFFQDFREISE